MEIKPNGTIVLGRELSDLDKFVVEFCDVVDRCMKYTLISGYVAILFGRSRGTEDVDMFIEEISFMQFCIFYHELIEKGFWALNADSPMELYSMLEDKLAIRFAVEGKSIPNMEVKFAKDSLDNLSIAQRQKVMLIKNNFLWVSMIPMQIAYKRYILKSPKDQIIGSKETLHQYGKI